MSYIHHLLHIITSSNLTLGAFDYICNINTYYDLFLSREFRYMLVMSIYFAYIALVGKHGSLQSLLLYSMPNIGIYIVSLYDFFNIFSRNLYPNIHKAMPLVQSHLPLFIAASSLYTLNILIGNIEAQLPLIHAASDPQQLVMLQEISGRTYSLLGDICTEANANVSFCNVPAHYQTAEWQAKLSESRAFWNSNEYSRVTELLKQINREIIALHKAGVTNQDSFRTKLDGSVILKTTLAEFGNRFAQAERRFEDYYGKRV